MSYPTHRTAISPLPRPHASPRPAEAGFVLLWFLFVVAALGVGMAALGTLWHTQAQRAREQELLFIGDQYRRAIISYRRQEGGQNSPPRKLDDLLLDPRFPHTVRHLRRLYPDPISGRMEWGLTRDADQGITGVHSLSERQPLKQAGFPAMYADFAGKAAYRGWVFSASAEDQAAPPVTAPGETTHPEANNASGGEGATIGPPPPATPPGTDSPKYGQKSEIQLQRLACLQEKEQAMQAECALERGQAQRNCHNQVFQRYRDCLNGLK